MPAKLGRHDFCLSASVNKSTVARRQIHALIGRHTTHKAFLEEYLKVLDSVKGCPRWVRERVCEYANTLIDCAHEHGDLVWCTLEWNGVRYTDWASIPDDGKDALRMMTSDDACDVQYHYWIENGVRWSSGSKRSEK